MKSPSQNFEMTVLVGDRPITEYQHDGGTFVEGRHTSEYKIRVRNNTYARACFIVSVDGLSVLDGKDSGNNSPGYILDGQQTLDIACYKVDSATGAKFVFGSKDKSYSAEIGKGTDNVGVIAMRVFKERPKPPQKHIAFPLPFPRPWIDPHWPSMQNVRWGVLRSASSGGGTSSSLSNAAVTAAYHADTGPSTHIDAAEDTQLGTQFGEAMAWATQTVIFNRETHPDSTLIIYYDTRKNLERRGVKFDRVAPALPNPFPANEQGCVPPANWRK